MRPTYHYQVDADGNLWHDGEMIDDPEFLDFFFKQIEIKSDGQIQIDCQGEFCLIHPQDTLYVVQQISQTKNGIELLLQGNQREKLDPQTLEVGKDNILYCKVKDRKHKARFNRKSYWELSKFIEEENQKFYLALDSGRFEIKSGPSA